MFWMGKRVGCGRRFAMRGAFGDSRWTGSPNTGVSSAVAMSPCPANWPGIGKSPPTPNGNSIGATGISLGARVSGMSFGRWAENLKRRRSVLQRRAQ